MPGGAEAAAVAGAGRLQRLLRRIWWLHSFGALGFGVGVMLFARRGLEHADKILLVLALSWLLVFVALRFIVGAANTSPDDKLARRGLRLVTNYIIKQLYQQMFFFLVPLYASSATWSLTSPNWWLCPLLLGFAVVSTMDLVFDNVIMQRRVLAASMYGVCVFAVLNLTIPLVFRVQHFEALLIAAGATAPTVALLSFRLRAVLSPSGVFITTAVTAALVAAAYYGRVAIPPAPMAMAHGGIGHGVPGQYECVPGPRRQLPADQLVDLRCVTEVVEPGAVDEPVVHVWRKDGAVLFREAPSQVAGCDGDVVVSRFPPAALPGDPRGDWSCTAQTGAGQLIGRLSFVVVAPRP